MKTITFGKHVLTDYIKPITNKIIVDWEWIVLGKYREPGAALLLSKDAIDWEFFSGENTFFEPPKPATWETSYMREFLDEFYDEGFTEEEKGQILTNSIGDHLFLLSMMEAYWFLPSKELRIAELEHAEDRCRYKISWWLNTVGISDPAKMMVVREDGKIDWIGVENDADEIGVRPAMIIRSLP